MTRQKSFKSRVRARMHKTGERYSAARTHLLERAAAAPAPTSRTVEMPASEEGLLRATGRRWDDWFAELDGSGAVERSHTETARWLVDERGVPGWWAQAITVGYERARGLRAKHQRSGGFAIDVTRTISADVEQVARSFTDEETRATWLGDVGLRLRNERPRRGARFDWLADGSRLVVHFDPRSDGRTVVSIQHERLPDEGAAERIKAFWRERLGHLKAMLDGATK